MKSFIALVASAAVAGLSLASPLADDNIKTEIVTEYKYVPAAPTPQALANNGGPVVYKINTVYEASKSALVEEDCEDEPTSTEECDEEPTTTDDCDEEPTTTEECDDEPTTTDECEDETKIESTTMTTTTKQSPTKVTEKPIISTKPSVTKSPSTKISQTSNISTSSNLPLIGAPRPNPPAPRPNPPAPQPNPPAPRPNPPAPRPDPQQNPQYPQPEIPGDFVGGRVGRKPPQQSPVKTPSPPSDNTSDDYQKAALDAHNSVRRSHGAPMLTWDASIADDARRNTEKCKMEHDYSGRGYGQNLAMQFSTSNCADKVSLIKKSVQMWYDEISLYPKNGQVPQTPNMKYLHFTQVVWKETTAVACYTHCCPQTDQNGRITGYSAYTACNYSPPGNFGGPKDYIRNVQV